MRLVIRCTHSVDVSSRQRLVNLFKINQIVRINVSLFFFLLWKNHFLFLKMDSNLKIGLNKCISAFWVQLSVAHLRPYGLLNIFLSFLCVCNTHCVCNTMV